MPLGAYDYLTSPESADIKRMKRHEWKLLLSNWLREEINEILTRYGVPSDVADADVLIDALCVVAVDKIEREVAAIIKKAGEDRG
jgi:predicted house-cleaning noncanonical NTP pyrophosphatase (MazG superfamily)